MNHNRLSLEITGLMLTVLLLVACSTPQPTPTPTPIPPSPTPTDTPTPTNTPTSTPTATLTPIPPTPTPTCSVECEGSYDSFSRGPSLSVEITCESGASTQTVFSYKGWVGENKETWGTHFNVERTYEDSGNTYEITAYAWEEYVEGAIKVRYHIEVTGGVFGETPQICGTD